jgi:hypothetical protein
MTLKKAFFQHEELSDELPAPGYYRSTITNAEFRRSASGNRMLQIVHCLDGVSPAHELVADYFVLEGASPTGVLMGRRRLVQLYRALGLNPKQDDEISPADLVEARVQLRVEHDEWESQPRLRVVGYRPFWPTEPDGHASV